MTAKKGQHSGKSNDYAHGASDGTSTEQEDVKWYGFFMEVLKQGYSYRAFRMKGFPGDVLVTVTLEKRGVPYVYYTSGSEYQATIDRARRAFIEGKAKLKVNEWEMRRRAETGASTED